MQEILLTLATCVVLSVLADVLISGGGIKKYARLALGISVSTILVIPIVNFLDSDFSESVDAITISEGYIQLVDSQYITILQQTAQSALLDMGIEAEIYCDVEDSVVTNALAVCNFQLTQERAEEVGYAVCEVLSLELWEVQVKER